VITLSLIYFGFVGPLYCMQFWLPQIVKAFGLTNAQTGFVTAIPHVFGTIAMILWARHSDATRERVARKRPATRRRDCWCSRCCRSRRGCSSSSAVTRPRPNSQTRIDL
jgi:hypothetical protein